MAHQEGQYDGDTYDIKIARNSDHKTQIKFEDTAGNAVDVSNWLFELLVVEHPSEQENVFHEMNLANGQIQFVNASNGEIEITLNPEEVEDLNFTERKYVLNIIDASGLKDRKLQGDIVVV